MSVQISVIQWKYSKRLDGTYPIKVRVMWKGKAKYWPVLYEGSRLSLTTTQFDLAMSAGRLPKKERLLKKAVDDAIATARSIVLKITTGGSPFSFQRFEREFSPNASPGTFFSIFNRYLSELLREGRIGTCKSYMNARSAFAAFLSKDIDLIDITPRLLREFENYLYTKRNVKSKNTVAIYMGR